MTVPGLAEPPGTDRFLHHPWTVAWMGAAVCCANQCLPSRLTFMYQDANPLELSFAAVWSLSLGSGTRHKPIFLLKRYS